MSLEDELADLNDETEKLRQIAMHLGTYRQQLLLAGFSQVEAFDLVRDRHASMLDAAEEED